MSKVFGYPTEFHKYLGGIQRDGNGKIVAAKAMLHTWTTQVKKTKQLWLDLGTGDTVDEGGMVWERALVQKAKATVTPGVKIHIHAAHSFGEVSAATIMHDIKWVACGWLALIIYVLVTLGRLVQPSLDSCA